jgi:hypothetical protein
MTTEKAGRRGRAALNKVVVSQSVALIAAEEFALSMVPLLLAVNEAGGIAAAIRILGANKKIPGKDPR